MKIQVFEYERLSVGTKGFEPKHFDALSKLSPSKYFRLQHRAVQFSQYVGAIQLGNLTIEILPKTDQYVQDKSLWRDVLLDMLRYCRLLKIETVGTAHLALKRHSILDIYYALFLEEVAQLLHRGIFCSYTNTVANRKSLKGQIQFAEQIRHNWLHKERFFTRKQTYNDDNIFNQIISTALDLLRFVPLPSGLQLQYDSLIQQFPQHLNSHLTTQDFQQLHFNRHNEHYRNAIQIARLLIQQNQPNLRSGEQSAIALLFDMNLLFEEYIFRQLCRVRSTSLHISRQQQKAFWNRQHIRPDIVLQDGRNRYVLDTKWKLLKTAKPAMQDLQQAFVYGQYFDAQTTVLLYPQQHNFQHQPPVAFQAASDYHCGLFFANVIQDGHLNLNIGEEILRYLRQD
ncbi:MAG: hypothetical protein AAGI23_10685 [Bacteroidota bacterium]